MRRKYNITASKEEIEQLYLVQWISREELANYLNVPEYFLKRYLKRVGITRKHIANCIICNSVSVHARARCKKCYKQMPDIAKSRQEYSQRPETKRKKAAYSREQYATNPKYKEHQRKHKNSQQYRNYMQQYNEQYRLTHNTLGRSYIYWQARWRLIQEQKVCSCCKSDQELETHHLKPVSACKREGWTEEQIHSDTNMILLCKQCHRSVETYSKWHPNLHKGDKNAATISNL